jgi:hypothetical protein
MFLLPDCSTWYGVHGDSSVLELTKHRIARRRVNLRQYFLTFKEPRARICKRLRSPGRVAVPARQAVHRFTGSLKALQMRAQEHILRNRLCQPM